MKRLMMVVLIVGLLALPVSATEYTAPTAPDSAQDLMPVEQTSFGKDLWTVVQSAVSYLEPEITGAAGTCVCLIAVVLLIALLSSYPSGSAKTVQVAGVVAVAALLLQQTQTMVHTAAATVAELSEYGKLLTPTLTAALAAQGGLSASSALYVGTAVFDSVLSTAISRLLVPLVYVFLALAVAGCATSEPMLDKLRDFVKWLATWSLKTILYIFTGYITVTGVVSGSADAATLKATKLTMSGMIPVVGGILSDASEAVLVGAGVMKSAVGVYGLLAVIAVWISPFLRIGVQYLLLKLTAALCESFGVKPVSAVIGAFSDAMGLLLAMTSSICILLLISVVCFMKGIG